VTQPIFSEAMHVIRAGLYSLDLSFRGLALGGIYENITGINRDYSYGVNS
jgi:hypothetical protein